MLVRDLARSRMLNSALRAVWQCEEHCITPAGYLAGTCYGPLGIGQTASSQRFEAADSCLVLAVRLLYGLRRRRGENED